MTRISRAVIAWGLSACAASGAVFAEQGDTYGAVMGGLAIPDKDRDAEHGMNLQGLVGFSLDERHAVEVNGFYHRTARESDGAIDRAGGGGLDLHIGARREGLPFFLIGVGGAYDDEEVSPYLNAGAGYYLPISAKRDLLRLELRWNGIYADRAGGDTELLSDLRLNFGVAFGARRPEAAWKLAEKAKAHAIADADGDGVADALDRCPETPSWLRVDLTGCGPDADRDNVPDGMDLCPDTPADERPNEKGCSPAQRDTDGDSVTDDRDLCPDTGRELQADANGCINLEKALLGSVHFGLTADGLNREGFELLDHVAAALRARPDTRVEILGHADKTGDASYNTRLSTRRAYAAREYLVYRGISPERLEVMGVGEAKPIADNSTEDGRARNRRVEFRVIQMPQAGAEQQGDEQ